MTDPSNRAHTCWVVIPAYNEAHTVRDVARRARQQCPHVVVVDDGSMDGTAEALTGLNVSLLRNPDNLGKAGSLWRGFEYALSHGAASVITLDADGQHAPEEIPLLLEAAEANPHAFLIGARLRDQRKTAIWRYLANRVGDFWIGWAAGEPIEDSQSGFRLYPAALLRAVDVPRDHSRSFVFESEILIEAVRSGFSCRTVSVTVSPRAGPRPSHFRPLGDIAGIVRMVAWRLLSQGFNPKGLWRILRGAVHLPESDRVLRVREEAPGVQGKETESRSGVR